MSNKVAFLDSRDQLVEVLESVLQRAKEGQLSAVMIAATTLDGNGCLHAIRVVPGRHNVWAMIGAVENVKHQLFRAVDQMEHKCEDEGCE